MKNLISIVVLTSLVLATTSGCFPQIKPTVYSESLYTENKPIIYILPLADTRMDTSETGNFNRWSTKILSRSLRRKGYKTMTTKDQNTVNTLEEDQLTGLRDTVTTEAERALIAHLGPDNARWILLPVLQDFHSKVVLGCKATADANAYLLDKQTGITVLWHKAEGDGSIGLLLCPMAGKMAVEDAFTRIISAFPKNPPLK